MLDKLMQISLQKRLIVVVCAIVLVVVGVYTASNLPVDVFPDLTAPTVTIMTEAHGMAPEEVEALVTFPIETAVNGASGVRRVRSNSLQGLSTVIIEFEWGTEIYLARQIVNEKLQTISLPDEVDQPLLTPVTSIMGEIMMVGMTSDSTTSLMDLRTLAEFNVLRRIQAVPGVAQVLVYGGEKKQYQVLIDPHLLMTYDITLNDVVEAVSASNVNASGGFYIDKGQEHLIRGMGRIHDIEDLGQTVVTVRNGVPLLVKDVAKVQIGSATKLGTVAINEETGIILMISRQPDANTLKLTENIEVVLEDIRASLPEGVILHTDLFKQSDFIERAIENVIHALRDGALLVVVILFIFLLNFRTTIISVVAIPVSLIIAIFVLKMFDLSINTMTLGGMAIAIGVLVDDAIIYVENVYRRLRQNSLLPEGQQRGFSNVVADASAEIRTPIAMATFIVVIVFIPFLFLGGIEGRMLKPLGLAYAVSIIASLLVAVTLTPAMSSYLLRNVSKMKEKESIIVVTLKKIYLPVLTKCMDYRGVVIGVSALLVLGTIIVLPYLGRSFLPEFNEGTLTLSVVTLPGTALDESDDICKMVDKMLLSHEEVTSVARRTGRTEMDEHSMGPHSSEIEVVFHLHGKDKEQFYDELREDFALLPGTNVTIGQPISHRIDHMLSGTRANIAVKLFGTDLIQLRQIAKKIEGEMKKVEGAVDIAVGQQVDVPQVKIVLDRHKLASYGLTAEDVDKMVDAAFLGEEVSQVFENNNRFDLIVRYEEKYRNNLEAIKASLIDTPLGGMVPLEMVADIYHDYGPNYISRENVQRKIVVQANVSGRDLRSVVGEIEQNIADNVALPQDYYIQFGGQFESEEQATKTVTYLSILSILIILLVLYMEFGNFRQALLVMANLPLALIGGVVALFLTDGIMSIASLVGFITLFGIAVRNGIIMVSHYNHLIDVEGKSLAEAVIQGSMERLSPILMTAMTTGLALTPLAFSGHKPGSEIQSPMSIVILGGLISATILNMIVVPALFSKWGARPKKLV
jgi:CzcA family heavy metal efflux pump